MNLEMEQLYGVEESGKLADPNPIEWLKQVLHGRQHHPVPRCT